ncbi:TIGR03560 family F420-dependent LLM class oxidoreductase [Agromyces sp. CFH 90414]|uniref:TIGR03560 family F420-dependent LLM class oxidoreductase n=1 Tax=Agromyces agglutinans TaxID=2662258 RepID=A0A6I2FBA0_9MICO|nr:LLM class F420-dependent oxidoreductase [Agromyces agglutinans]MRG59716.1 TIGR03560 family F420-dependent LLM class oxidoreductase [Agromyces agglutinans]
MKFRIFTEPQQGATYGQQVRMAQAAERLGFDAWFRSDHFLAMDVDPGPGPTDSWVTLGALARETSTIRLGTLVTSATFRHPSLLAIQVAQVDEMSGGRVEFGLGTGWFAAEHEAYGFPFPERRFGILEEQLEVVTGLWSTPAGETFSHAGEHYTLKDAPALPKPVQQPIPLIVGGAGPKRTPAIAARFAGEYNVAFRADAEIAAGFARVREAVEAAGRPADSMRYSAALTSTVGETDASYRARAERIGRDPEELRRSGVAGTPQQLVDRIGGLRDLGVETIYLQVLDFDDLDVLELLASEVVPVFAE